MNTVDVEWAFKESAIHQISTDTITATVILQEKSRLQEK